MEGSEMTSKTRKTRLRTPRAGAMPKLSKTHTPEGKCLCLTQRQLSRKCHDFWDGSTQFALKSWAAGAVRASAHLLSSRSTMRYVLAA